MCVCVCISKWIAKKLEKRTGKRWSNFLIYQPMLKVACILSSYLLSSRLVFFYTDLELVCQNTQLGKISMPFAKCLNIRDLFDLSCGCDLDKFIDKFGMVYLEIKA